MEKEKVLSMIKKGGDLISGLAGLGATSYILRTAKKAKGVGAGFIVVEAGIACFAIMTGFVAFGAGECVADLMKQKAEAYYKKQEEKVEIPEEEEE